MSINRFLQTVTPSRLICLMCSMCVLALSTACGGGQNINGSDKECLEAEGCYRVTAIGPGLEEAKKHARGNLIEKGIGVWIKKQSASYDGRLIGYRISSRSEGFVRNLKVLSQEKIPGGIQILAQGYVSAKKLEEALEEKYKKIGKPRFMAIINETIGSRKVKPGNTLTERKLVEEFSEIIFIDKNLYRKRIARESGKLVGDYNNPSHQEKALSVAAELDAEVLIIGQNKIKKTNSPTGDKQVIQSSISYKVINVGTAHILAAGAESALSPDTNMDRGAPDAVQKVIKKIAPGLEKQILSKWKAGATIRLTIKGLSCREFRQRKTSESIKNIYGVVNVETRKCSGTTSVLEVEALYNGTILLQNILDNAEDMGLVLRTDLAQGNILILTIRRVR